MQFLVKAAVLMGVVMNATPGVAAVDFNRDIRPLISDRCFLCHGPAESTRKGGLRIDHRADAVKAGAIVPGKPDDSELIKRVFSSSTDDRMPPPPPDTDDGMPPPPPDSDEDSDNMPPPPSDSDEDNYDMPPPPPE